jgi:hypothetical protein
MTMKRTSVPEMPAISSILLAKRPISLVTANSLGYRAATAPLLNVFKLLGKHF